MMGIAIFILNYDSSVWHWRFSFGKSQKCLQDGKTQLKKTETETGEHARSTFLP